MSVKLNLSLAQELKMLQQDCEKFHTLFPYEKEYFLRRIKELALLHEDIIGPALTKSILSSIQELTISR